MKPRDVDLSNMTSKSELTPDYSNLLIMNYSIYSPLNPVIPNFNDMIYQLILLQSAHQCLLFPVFHLQRL